MRRRLNLFFRDRDDLLEQLPALQQLLFRLVGCQVVDFVVECSMSKDYDLTEFTDMLSTSV
jgi:hypothetical protein